MSESGSRRAVAEIRFGEDRTGLTKVGGRSIHQYWSLLSPHFRDVLLAPQRRSDDGGVSWTWREAAENRPLTAAELTSVRKRLERAKESFEENPVNPMMGDARSGASSQELIDQVASKVKALAESLAAKSDAVLAPYVCRTENGPMIHSWGVASAAAVIYPDSLETGISGVVVVGGKPSSGHEVVIENSNGLSVARVYSDESGEFAFLKIGPGRYRVRVVSGRVKFPAKGVTVTVERGAVSRLQLQSTSDSNENAEKPDDGESSESDTPDSANSPEVQERGGQGWLKKTTIGLLLVLLVVGGGVFAWRTWRADQPEKRDNVRVSSMAPEDFSNTGKSNSAHPLGTLGDSDKLGAAVDGVGPVDQRRSLHGAPTSLQKNRATASGVGKFPSTIDTKIDVLSSAAEKGSSVGNPADNTSNESTVPADSTEAGSGFDQTGSNSTIGATSSVSQSSSKHKPASRSAGESSPNAHSKRTSTQPAEIEAPSGENREAQPGGKAPEAPVTLPAEKKPGTRPPQGAATASTRPTDDAPWQNDVAASEASPENASEEVAATGPGSGLPQEKAPIAKISIVKKTADSGNPSASRATSDDVGAGASAAADSQNSASKPARRGKNEPSGRTKSSEGSGPGTQDDPTSELLAQDGAASTTAAVNGTPSTAPNNRNVGGGGEASPSGGTVTADGQPARGSKDNSAAPKDSVSARPSVAAARRSAVTKKRTIENAPSAASDEMSDTDQAEAAGAPSPDSLPPGSNPALNSVARSTTGLIRFSNWEPRLLRDAIVPTVPVLVGQSDPADLLREKMRSDENAHQPDVFKHLSARRGFVFELSAGPGKGALLWQDLSSDGKADKIADAARAEIAWGNDSPSPGSQQVLRFADGREAARVTFKENGRLVLRLAEGVRCTLLLTVKDSPRAESDAWQANHGPRFVWRINGVDRVPPKNRMNPVPESSDHVLRLPLDVSKDSRWEVALSDQQSRWALVTTIQLRPGL